MKIDQVYQLIGQMTVQISEQQTFIVELQNALEKIKAQNSQEQKPQIVDPAASLIGGDTGTFCGGRER